MILLAFLKLRKQDMDGAKKILDKMKWTGWLVIERSRDANRGRDVKGNYGANTTYLKKIFQSRGK